MLFSSLEFLYFFLPIIIPVYFALGKRCNNIILLIASLFLYYYAEQNRILLLILSAAAGYFSAVLISRSRIYKKLIFTVSAVFIIGILVIFKYTDFIISILNSVFRSSMPTTGIVLPIGISFYTFQVLSYVIDIYRGDVRVQKDFLKLSTYIAFFPQLIAGPIVRYQDIEHELDERSHSLKSFSKGAERFAVGLGKKVLIANMLYKLCSDFGAVKSPSVLFYWLYAVAYTLHIYFDFSGYSDMAIGLGKIFGFEFPENFNYPFAADSISDFWRRWHMTLGRWFRDYVYIPLGGNRVAKSKFIRNIMIVWMLTGLWHGAAWNFVLWGLYFGILLCCEKLLWGKYLERIHPVFRHVYVILLLIISFVIFDSNSVSELLITLRGMFGIGNKVIADDISLYYLKNYALLIIVSTVLSLPVLPALNKKLINAATWYKCKTILMPIAAAVIIITCTAFLVGGSYNPFLYFRF